MKIPIVPKVQEKLMRRKYEASEEAEQTFTAFIVKGNRQVIRREVSASKRFLIDGDTYVIRPECIFLKNVDGYLTSVSYYREGNPNPYSFKEVNKGISATELDRLFSEDFFHIITDLQLDSKTKYVLLIVIINMMLAVSMLMKVVIFGV